MKLSLEALLFRGLTNYSSDERNFTGIGLSTSFDAGIPEKNPKICRHRKLDSNLGSLREALTRSPLESDPNTAAVEPMFTSAMDVVRRGRSREQSCGSKVLKY